MQNIEDLIVDGGISVFEAMRRLDETGRRIVFIAPGGKLEAVLTDSDVRRYILRGGDLARPVGEMANKSPRTLSVEKRGSARAFLRQHSIDAAPILDKQGIMVDIVFVDESEDIGGKRQLNLPVVVMAGGLGTRLYPYTKILPKPLIPVGEVPIVELVIRNFHDFGCDDFTLIVNHKRNMIKSYFADIACDYTLKFVDEEQPLGTGGGLSLLKGKINETFFFTNCDILINADYADIAKFHKEQGNAVTMVCAMKHFTIPYGVVELDGGGGYAGISEKPEMNLLTNTGMYVVEPGVVDAVAEGIAQGFPDIIEQCRERGERVGVYPVSDGSWMDMGQLEELEQMRRRLENGE